VPFGPQHPVLPEPIHFDLTLEDEKIVEAMPSIGYIHRGLEILTTEHDFMEMAYVAERICGICSFIHGMGYCQAIEQHMGISVPKRAQYLRVIWSEFSRLHSHMMWLGLLADAMGYESLFMHSWRVRELVLDIFEESTGGRVIFGVVKPGGVRRDMGPDMLSIIRKQLPAIEKGIDAIAKVFLHDTSVKMRLSGMGYLSPEETKSLGCVGPMARASGLSMDTRKNSPYSSYEDFDFKIETESGCDSWARVAVRVKELYQSVSIIKQAMEKIPDGEIWAKPQGFPPVGDQFTRLEQPRGEVIYYIKGNGTKNLERFRVRTPTFANVPSMVHLIGRAELADVGLLVLTIDPCISCTER
jgi:ech hydrogenase subunit E